jgi:hypothetical protein
LRLCYSRGENSPNRETRGDADTRTHFKTPRAGTRYKSQARRRRLDPEHRQSRQECLL